MRIGSAIAVCLLALTGSAALAQRDERTPPSCEANFGCASGSEISVGVWPDCSCVASRTPEKVRKPPPPPPDPPRKPPPTLEEECSMHFQCPDPFKMLNWNGRCVCGQEVLAPPR